MEQNQTQESQGLRSESAPPIRPKRRDPLSAYEARIAAQKLAFAPVAFQVARALRDQGVLQALEDKHAEGLTLDALNEHLKDLPYYALKLLLDGGLVAGILLKEGDRYFNAKLGHFLLKDNLTRVNMDFVNDVCYEGLFRLEESLVQEKPLGLKVFGDWPVIYDGLAELPAKAKQSWFAFDHFYSDSAFNHALPYVFKHNPKTLLDIGGNTGRFSTKCLAYAKDVQITLADLPPQIKMAQQHFATHTDGSRMTYIATNILADDSALPGQFDVIWMSQFLDCFSPDEIRHILRRAVKSLRPGGELFILETYCDRQKYDVSRYCVVNTSFYFTCMANGNSRMYDAEDMLGFVKDAGLSVTEDRDEIGFSHTLFRCVRT